MIIGTTPKLKLTINDSSLDLSLSTNTVYWRSDRVYKWVAVWAPTV